MEEEKIYKILVVDDEDDLCEILKFNLETDGYQVTMANSAEDALKLDIASFDLLLLDVMMGGMSGFAMAKQLKANPSTANVPIIFLTARDTENDTVTGFNLGADDYISKPFSLREVLVRVRAVLRRTSERQGVEPAVLRYQGLEMNLDKKTVSIDGENVPLPRPSLNCSIFCLRRRDVCSPARSSSIKCGPRMCSCWTGPWMSTSHDCARRSGALPSASSHDWASATISMLKGCFRVLCALNLIE